MRIYETPKKLSHEVGIISSDVDSFLADRTAARSMISS